MRTYIHNPDIYRRHYKAQIGRALPGFSGSRMQHGEGIGAFLGSMARKALPLISSGLKMAKPHLTRAAKGVAKDLTHQAADMVVNRLSKKSPKSAAIVKNIVNSANFGSSNGRSKGKAKRKSKRKPVIKRKKRKGTRSKDIF